MRSHWLFDNKFSPEMNCFYDYSLDGKNFIKPFIKQDYILSTFICAKTNKLFSIFETGAGFNTTQESHELCNWYEVLHLV